MLKDPDYVIMAPVYKKIHEQIKDVCSQDNVKAGKSMLDLMKSLEKVDNKGKWDE